jgi:hypothetical protein
VDTARDLARADPWRESLERSEARRRPRRAPSRLKLPTVGAKRIAVLALAAAIIASRIAGGGSHDAPTAARADAGPQPGTPGSIGVVRPSACPLAVTPAGYVNPLAGAVVKPERIDQGVDYAGRGTLVSMGAARVTYLATSNSGWPGAFIEYQLLSGADAGCYVFYAEGVTPVPGLSVGQTLAAGEPVATIIPKWPTGIELGWGAGTSTKAYAKVAGQWSPAADADNVATAAGQSFSALIAALGGPPGKVEG